MKPKTEVPVTEDETQVLTTTLEKIPTVVVENGKEKAEIHLDNVLQQNGKSKVIDIEKQPINEQPHKDTEEEIITRRAQTMKIIIGIVAYSLCSSSLLLLNKVAVTYLPSTAFVLLCQFISSLAVVKFCGLFGWLDVDELSWEKVKKFYGVSLFFSACLYTNVMALKYANVETLIVFRALSPIAVSVCDFFFMDMELPNLRSWIALFTIVLGAGAYVYFDGAFKLDSYVWVVAYFISIVSEMVYVKHVITEVKMTTWGRVYYNNFLSILPVLIFGFIFNDYEGLLTHTWSFESIFFLLLSCVVGVGISYAGFYLRALVSATSFTVIGVVNKLATTVANVMVWDKHANSYGIVALLFCILGGTFYQQSPKKKT
jgi:solute carrier family 35 protein